MIGAAVIVASVAVADGHVYLATMDNLYCIGPKGATRDASVVQRLVVVEAARIESRGARGAERAVQRVLDGEVHFVAAVDQVGLCSRAEAGLDRSACWKILACHHVQDELHILVPMDALFLGARRLRHI